MLFQICTACSLTRRRYHTNPKYLPFPSQHVFIRGIREETYTVVDITQAGHPKLLEEIEVSRALFETYEGAVVSVLSLFVLSQAALNHFS